MSSCVKVARQECSERKKGEFEVPFIAWMPHLIRHVGMVCFKVACHVRIIETAVVSRQASVDDELFVGTSKGDSNEKIRGQKCHQQEPRSHPILHAAAPINCSTTSRRLLRP